MVFFYHRVKLILIVGKEWRCLVQFVDTEDLIFDSWGWSEISWFCGAKKWNGKIVCVLERFHDEAGQIKMVFIYGQFG
jgi:hypothetical protein